MIELVGMHRTDQADIVNYLAQVGQLLRNLGATFTLFAELELWP